MHISEGVLSTPVLLAGGALTVVGSAIGLKTLDYERIMTVSLLTATFFVASLIHVPLGPGNIHLVLGGLMGIVLGWSCFPAILVALELLFAARRCSRKTAHRFANSLLPRCSF